MQDIEPNELNVRYLSTLGLNPWIGNNSSPRSQMFSSHITQRLIINGATPHRFQTGMEQEFGKYTLSVQMPANGVIVRAIDRYPKTLAQDNINFNPETLVIYEDDDTKKLGCFSIPYYNSYHQYFGFKYNLNSENIGRLTPGSFIPKGTIFADTPAVADNGDYKYGIELNMAFISHPAVSEDGILICEDVLPKLRFKVYETRVIGFGNGSFPLNLYGDTENYKPFPDIGEVIRDDGILCATRDYNYALSPVEMSINDVLDVDYIFDTSTYVRGPGGKIVDIKIYHDDNVLSTTPMGVELFLTKYTKALKCYYKEILAVEASLRYNRKKKFSDSRLPLQPELHRLLVEARTMTDDGGVKASQKLNHLYRKNPLDDYRVEFVIEYEITPNIGFKLTDLNGGKQ